MSVNHTHSRAARDALDDFLRARLVRKSDDGAPPAKASTNTRIGDPKSGIHGGNYHIPVAEQGAFLALYHAAVVAPGGLEYITEKQLDAGGPILVDLDMRFSPDVRERLFAQEHVYDMLCVYVDELRKIYQFDPEIAVPVFVFEKAAVNHLPEKETTKDGLHIIVGIRSDHTTQCILRERVMARAPDVWGYLPLTNGWEDVFDAGISKGVGNWQLYGSRKPHHDAYCLKYAYTLLADPTDGEIAIRPTPDLAALTSLAGLPKLSARYAEHPELFMTHDFAAEHALARAAEGGAPGARRPPSVFAALGGGAASGERAFLLEALFKARDRAQLDACVDRFLATLAPADIDLRESHDYAMCLPPSYYGPGSYTRWMKVGWALRNTSDALFVVWAAFSAQAPNFCYRDIRDDLYERWLGFDMQNSRGLTRRSLMHWAKQDAPAKYRAVRTESIDFCIEETLDKLSVQNLSQDRKTRGRGCGDFDLATVLHQMFKDEYVCVSVKNNVWYRYRGHRWSETDSGTELRRAISEDIQRLYVAKVNALNLKMIAENVDLSDTNNPRVKHANNILDIVRRLSQTSEKNNIMIESKELFYDGGFLDRLDANTHLLCCANGVVDFTEKVFRAGRPEDCLSKCTNIDYAELDATRDAALMTEITDFMHKLFPDADLHRYMWDHLASTLIGDVSEQTLNMYIGEGQNGKSVMVNLMAQCLGDYKGDVPLTLITQARTKIGGLAPELVQLKGVRYAVIQEPSKGDVINEGVMKQLTGGDPIQCRAPYMTKIITYVPQFKLALCSNTFMEIKAQDHGTWRRVRVVDFVSLFTDTPVADDPDKPFQFKLDRRLMERFAVWRSVFLAMLAQRAFATGGAVADCPKVLASSNSYRERQDCFAEFIGDRISSDPQGVLTKTAVVAAFREWYAQNYGFKSTTTKDITAYLDKVFGKNRGGVWTGARLKADAEDAEEGDCDAMLDF